jgi:Tol biopolymer transport system component
VHVHTTYPFHRFYNIYKDPFFRPAWSPDGQTVVFSDGLNLYRWQVGTPAATVIANTRDAVWPAWSPDGQTIAFTRLLRLFDAQMDCFCVNSKGEVTALYETTLYQNPGRIGRLVVMNADGSNMRVLGDGTAPAWMPNSRNVIAARSEGLYFIDVTNAAATLIPNTEGGTEPAVSPDGTRLVFARATANGSHDIWKIRLQ